LEITRVGFGAWAIGGGGWEFGWGPQEDEESIQTIHRALELGVNWIDTAAAYGFGVSNLDVGQLQRIQQIAPVETLQPPYSLIAREVEDTILPFAEHEGIGVIVYSPMGSGLLTGAMTRERIQGLPDNDWRKHSERFQEPQLSENLAVVERLKRVAARMDTTPGAVAVAWALRHPAVDGAIIGLRRRDQVASILHGAGLELSDADVAEIENGKRLEDQTR
jgi:aryl-alcohol dehydrogenase-like predicted oxidoreductase